MYIGHGLYVYLFIHIIAKRAKAKIKYSKLFVYKKLVNTNPR